MGAATTKFFMLLTATASPSPRIYSRCSPAVVRSVSQCMQNQRQCRSLNVFRLYPFHDGIRFLSSSRHFDVASSALRSSWAVYSAAAQHPWPEWSGIVDYLSAAGYFNNLEAAGSGLDFNFPAGTTDAFFSFARHHPEILWKLPRKEIEVLIQNGIPFLFENGGESIRRMKLFLTSSVLESGDRAEVLVDLMKYLLSYAHNALLGRYTYNSQSVESSVRNLIVSICEMGRPNDLGSPPFEGMQNSEVDGFHSMKRSVGVNIEMKSGDWICPRCSFLNFARNKLCLECDEVRPKRVLPGGEWECPQCDFYNYRRNAVCLRCDCKRPSDVSFARTNADTGSGVRRNLPQTSVDSESNTNEENTKQWLSKLSIADTDSASGIPKQDSVFASRNRKTPLERRVNYVQRQRNANTWGTMESYSYQNSRENITPDVKIYEGSSSSVSFGGVENTSSRDADLHSSSSDHSMIANHGTYGNKPRADDEMRSSFLLDKNGDEQPAKSEPWFEKVSKLHNINDASSEIPDFMPTRSGENRFVVSKKKDRSLASPSYKKSILSRDSGNPVNYVPFVPFPPNYFRRTDDVPQNGSATDEPLDCSVSGNIEGDSSMNSTRKNEEISVSSSHGVDKKWDAQTYSMEKKSLEGSLVNEPDLLDMSEEAKTERWFKRVAQIKDISELSEIPDEDFPSIMPMRKGVNRFVVTKRKTLLERRLASDQFNRNSSKTYGTDD